VGWFEPDKVSLTCANVARRGGAYERAAMVSSFSLIIIIIVIVITTELLFVLSEFD
jgi:hypothetical protein